MLAALILPNQIMWLLTDKAHIAAEGAKYLQIVAFGFVLSCVSRVLTAAMRSVEVAKLGLWVAAAALCISVAGNYLFIFGNLGFPELGVQGAAVTTVISRVVECSIVVFYILRVDKRVRFRVKDLFSHNRKLFKDYLRVGLPVIGASVMWAIGLFVQTAIMGRLRSDAVLAANAVAMTLFQLLSAFCYGLASASGVIIGKTVGESDGDLTVIKTYTKRLQVMYIIVGIATGLAMFMLKDIFLTVYSISDEGAALAVRFITVLSVMVVGTAYQMSCLTGIVRGGGDTKFVLINDMIFIWLVVIPSSLIAAFVFGAPPAVVFICLKCDQILKCFVAVVHVNRFRWVRRLTV
jgi:putative MATE family efflux protein